MGNKYLLIIAVLFLGISCKKDKPEAQQNPIVDSNSKGVYIVNEGGFGHGNGSVSYFSPSDSSVSEELFKAQNNKGLGDVCQSLTFYNQKGYIVVNNSQKVEVVDQTTFKSLATIFGFTSPRYFLPVSSRKAYVTDLYADKIAVVNLSSNSISSYINCKGWTEELVLSNGKAFVCSPHGDKVYVIQASNDQLIDSITVSYGSTSIRADKNGKLWVICSGDSEKKLKGALHRLNPIGNVVEQSFVFPDEKSSPWRLELNPSKDTLYYLNKGVFRMSIYDSSLPILAFIEPNGKNFYGLGIHPVYNEIYVSDALDYIQKSNVYRYNAQGKLIQFFKAGIISGNFAF